MINLTSLTIYSVSMLCLFGLWFLITLFRRTSVGHHFRQIGAEQNRRLKIRYDAEAAALGWRDGLGQSEDMIMYPGNFVQHVYNNRDKPYDYPTKISRPKFGRGPL